MTLPSYASGLLFTKAHQLVRQRVLLTLARHDLTPTRWAIMGRIAAAPEGIRLATVAEQVEMTPPMITVIAGELIELGLIKRIPHHTDGRAKLLVMTPLGKKLAAVIEQELNHEIQQLLQGLTTDEIYGFQKTLETIIRNATV